MEKPSQNNKLHAAIDEKVLPILDIILHIAIIVLIVALIVTIFKKLTVLSIGIFQFANLSQIVDDILFTLILLELFTILYSYLTKHYIKVERVIEVGIISIVREEIFKVFELEITRIYALAVLLGVFGAIFFIEKYFSKSRDN